MDLRCTPASSLHSKFYGHPSSWPRNPPTNTTIGFKISNNGYYTCLCYHHCREKESLFTKKRPPGKKGKKIIFNYLRKKPSEVDEKKKGSVAGAVALVIGTSIGSGILALPEKAAPAGLVASSISVIVCWAFLLIEALLLVEINVALMKKKRKKGETNDLEVISIRTMARETLGEWGGTIATVAYVFLGYSSLVAYSSKSGEIIFQLINLPAPISGCLFTALFSILISIGGTRRTDQVNQWLTASMIGLLLAIEVLAVVFGGWVGVVGSSDWAKVPKAIPVIIFSLVYHDITPVLCAFLEGDIHRIKASVILGSLVPLVALLVWDAVALGLVANTEQVVDPVAMLYRVRWSGVSLMIRAFSLLAVCASLIGTLLGFSEFFKEQLKAGSRDSTTTQGNWWERNKVNFMAMTMVAAPSLFVSTTFPDAFSAATEICGGYFMTVLYGVLPPAMAWTMHKRAHEFTDQKALSNAWPALILVGLLASGIVVEQILQDTLALHSKILLFCIIN